MLDYNSAKQLHYHTFEYMLVLFKCPLEGSLTCHYKKGLLRNNTKALLKPYSNKVYFHFTRFRSSTGIFRITFPKI